MPALFIDSDGSRWCGEVKPQVPFDFAQGRLSALDDEVEGFSPQHSLLIERTAGPSVSLGMTRFRWVAYLGICDRDVESRLPLQAQGSAEASQP
jgi:hypothetical protein